EDFDARKLPEVVLTEREEGKPRGELRDVDRVEVGHRAMTHVLREAPHVAHESDRCRAGSCRALELLLQVAILCDGRSGVVRGHESSGLDDGVGRRRELAERFENDATDGARRDEIAHAALAESVREERDGETGALIVSPAKPAEMCATHPVSARAR